MKDTWRARLKPLEVEIRTISTLIVFGVHIAPSIFRDGELRQPGKHSRHHTKDKQRLVLSVVAYDSLPGHQATLLCARLRFCAIALRERWPAGPLRRASPSRSSCRGRINSYVP